MNLEGYVMTTGSAIQQMRKENKMTQQECAVRVKCSTALISAYERNVRAPSLEKLVRLAEVLHTSTDFLLGRCTSGTIELQISMDDLDDRRKEILIELIATTPQKKSVL